MTFDGINLKELASEMVAARVRSLKWNGLEVVLDERAFSPESGPMPDLAKTFAEPPSAEQLQYWSVEGEPEEPKE